MNNKFGPELPSNLIESSDDEDFYGPSLPPATHTEIPHTDAPIIGPLPPGDNVPSKSNRVSDHTESIDGSDPLVLTHKPETERQCREEWMTELPDCLKSSCGFSVSEKKETSPDEENSRSLWTSISGRMFSEPKKPKMSEVERKAMQQEAAEYDEKMWQIMGDYNKHNSEVSLLELHQKRRKTTKEEEEREMFDPSKDLQKFTGRRSPFVSSNNSFGCKFSHGKTTGAFLR